jgi:hypothetical protein
MSSIKSAIKQRLCEQFIQKWFSDLDNSAREFYEIVKTDFKFKEYLIRLSKQDRVCITKLLELQTWNFPLKPEDGIT